MSARGKTAIILTGGGMRSAHGAGFLYALATKLHITHPDIIIASSGNAGNALYYATGQYAYIKTVWTSLLSTPRFISPLRFWRMMNIDYLVDNVFKKQTPLNTHALKTAPIQWFISITDTRGFIRYVSQADSVDPFELLRAAKAIPLLFRKAIRLFHHSFIDGELGPTLEDHIRCATKHGATRILVVENARPSLGLGQLLLTSYAYMAPAELRKVIVRDMHTHTACASTDTSRLICVSPATLPASLMTRDVHKLQQTFAQGEADALALEKELHAFFA